MDKAALDEFFERLLKAIAALRAPETHVHVHTSGSQRVQKVEEVHPAPIPYTG